MMKKMGGAAARVVLWVGLLGLLASCATVRFIPDRAHGFVARAQGAHRYHVYLPADWSRDRTWPVIVYLHGGGERGQDGVAPTQVGLGPAIQAQGGRFPFIAVFPQCAGGTFWAAPQMEARVLAAIDDVVRNYGGDPRRIILTGNSMGGYGTWILGARHPGRFAALAPICGGVVPPGRTGMRPQPGSIAAAPDPYAAAARAIGQTPVWAFHGARDWLVPPKISRKLVAALRAAGNDARYTEFPGVGHEAEEPAYRLAALFEWMAAQAIP